MSNIFRNFVKDSLTTRQNEAPTALGVLNSNSTRNLRYKTWFKVDKGARKVCFMTKALLKNDRKNNDNNKIRMNAIKNTDIN